MNIKQEINKFKKYVVDNKNSILSIFVIVFLTYSIRLFFINTGIDNEIIINDYNGYKTFWNVIGRWSIYITKNVLYLNEIYNPFYVYILTIIFFASSSIIFSYTISKIINNTKKNTMIILLGAVYLTSPLYIEQFSFSLQSAEVSFALLLLSICYYNIYNYIYLNNKLSAIVSIVLLTYSFGTYQAFFPLFILMSASMFLIVSNFNKKMSKNEIKEIFKFIMIFLISFIIYTIISKIVAISYKLDNNYLSSQILWKKIGIRNCISSIIVYLKDTLFPNINSPYYNYSFIIFIILSLFIGIKNTIKNRNFFSLLSLFTVIISPYIICILEGTSIPPRTQFMYPFAIMILIIYAYFSFDNSKIKTGIIVISILTIIFQFKVSTDLLYNDQIRYEEDKRILTEVLTIAREKYDTDNKEIVFIGSYNHSTSFKQKGDVLGSSFFGWDSTEPVGSNRRICGFAKTIGLEYNCASLENYNKAIKDSEKMKSYPEKSYISEKENYIVVKLNNMK